MSVAWAKLTVGDDSAVLYPGCVIGRSWRADLLVNDPRVSEVHAVLSLRGGALKLRRLGGNLWMHGMPVEALTLREGMKISLADDLELTVDALMLPVTLPALSIEGGPPQPLTSPRLWVDGDGLYTREREGAIPVWSVDEDWYAGPEATPLDGPTTLAGVTLELVWLPSRAAELPTTRAGGLYAPLTIVARYDTVHLHQDGHPVLVLSGLPAKLVSELVEIGTAVGWEAVAAELWPGLDAYKLRRRWDKALAKLRAKLRNAGIRPDLVRSSGGQVSLVILDGDQLEGEL